MILEHELRKLKLSKMGLDQAEHFCSQCVHVHLLLYCTTTLCQLGLSRGWKNLGHTEREVFVETLPQLKVTIQIV
jgi:hypothetical protein